MSATKIFGIGFHKTATTSLGLALHSLGYRVTGPNWVHDPEIGRRVYDLAFGMVERYDAFLDNPWPVLYRELDARCPGSKFILTVRPTEEWIRSVLGHFGARRTPMREWIYGAGCPQGNEKIYVGRYERHNREVLEHFRPRPGDLLRLDISQGEGWEKLCPFLGKAIPPTTPFPHANKAGDRPQR